MVEAYPEESSPLETLAVQRGLGEGERDEFVQYVEQRGYEMDGMTLSTMQELYDEFVEDNY